MTSRVLISMSAMALAFTLTGCADQDPQGSPDDPSDGGLDVLAAFYPYYFVAERIGGDAVSVELITEPGVEPHDLELGPQQVSDIAAADVLIYQAGFQPAVDEAVEQNSPEHEVEVNGVLGRGPDVEDEDAQAEEEAHEEEAEAQADGEQDEGTAAPTAASSTPPADEHSEDEHVEEESDPTEPPADDEAAEDASGEEGSVQEDLDGDTAAGGPVTDEHGHEVSDLTADPHVWLDTSNMETIAGAVADAFAEADPDNAEDYRARAEELVEDLEDLDADYRDALENCERDSVVVNHAAFGHLTSRYGLDQLPVSGITPDAEPSPQRLAELAELIRERGITTVYTETLVSPRVAETLAAEAGVDTATLDPLEGLAEDDDRDYLDVMRDNLDVLAEGLGCDAADNGPAGASAQPSAPESPTAEETLSPESAMPTPSPEQE